MKPHAYLAKNNYKIAQVTVDFDDWAWNDPFARCKDKNDTISIAWLKKRYIENALESLDRAEIVSKHLFGRSIKHVLLLHIGAFDSEMISDLIGAFQKKNVVFIPLSDALKDPAYASVPTLKDTLGEFIYQLMRSRKESMKDLGLKPYDRETDQKLEKACL